MRIIDEARERKRDRERVANTRYRLKLLEAEEGWKATLAALHERRAKEFMARLYPINERGA